MRTLFSKIALTAGISLALTFTFSCSSDGSGDGGDPSGGGCGIAQTPSNLPRSSTSHDPHEACKNIVFNASTNFCYDGIVWKTIKFTLPSLVFPKFWQGQTKMGKECLLWTEQNSH